MLLVIECIGERNLVFPIGIKQGHSEKSTLGARD